MMPLANAQFRWLLFSLLLVGVLEAFTWLGFTLPPSFGLPIFLILILLIGHETIKSGFRALFSLNFRSINLLMLIAVFGALALGKYPEAAVVIILYNLAEKLEDLGIETSKSALQKLLESVPKMVTLKDSEQPLSIENVPIGAIYILRPGEMIPLDGEVVFGSTAIDESSITGEPLPKDKTIGDKVFAGTLNQQGYLEIQVTQLAANSSLAKIEALTREAFEKRATSERFIESFSYYYTPSIILLALFWTLFSPLFLDYPFQKGFLEALSLLVIACPCALVISTPISIYSSLGNAAQKGILIKGGEYLEGIALLKAMAFDKTRTLTYGNPIVTDLIPSNGHSVETLLSCAAGIESQSEHPLAKGIIEAAKKENYLPHFIENFQIKIGQGAQADCLVCDEREHWIGKLDFILQLHSPVKELLNQIHALQAEGKSVIIVSNKKEIEGLIALQDEIRPEAKRIIEEVKQLGLHVSLLTGDNRQSAQVVGQAIGIDDIQAEQLPEDKSKNIALLLQKFGYVGMIGDGINDAPALALATVGITTRELGSDTAVEAASIVFLNDHLKKLPFLIQLARRTLSTIKINTIAAIGVKFLFILLSLLGLSSLALAIFADVGMTLLVILNSLRLRNWSSRLD